MHSHAQSALHSHPQSNSHVQSVMHRHAQSCTIMHSHTQSAMHSHAQSHSHVRLVMHSCAQWCTDMQLRTVSLPQSCSPLLQVPFHSKFHSTQSRTLPVVFRVRVHYSNLFPHHQPQIQQNNQAFVDDKVIVSECVLQCARMPTPHTINHKSNNTHNSPIHPKPKD